VLLDSVQFQKTGGTWTNRVQMLVGGKPTWLTVPIVRNYHGTRLIAEMEINAAENWRDKLLKTLQTNYGRAPHYADVFPFVEARITHPTTSLSAFNTAIIRALVERLGLGETELVLSSTLATRQHSTDLLIEITRLLNGTVYLSGGGAGGYQEDEKFARAGIELRYQRFAHPVYPQFNSPTFTAGLSILDALFNCGFAGTAALLTPPEPDSLD
jgi:hypothetical protein